MSKVVCQSDASDQVVVVLILGAMPGLEDTGGVALQICNWDDQIVFGRGKATFR